MEKTKPQVQKHELLRFLEGHRKTNQLIQADRRIQLSQLTEQESLRAYDSLCGFWEATPKKEGIERLERQRISFLLERRRRLNQAGGRGRE